MKLYTEEQVKQVWKSGQKYWETSGASITLEELLEQLTPIELPSDEEIEEKYYKELEERREVAKNFKGQVAGRHPDMFGVSEIHHMVTGYLECVKWMRNKIQGGNK